MENNDNGRKHFSAEMKFKIVKEALTTDQSITEVCKKYGVAVSVFYRWQEHFFSGAKEGLTQSKAGPTAAEQRKISLLEQENQRLKGVIAEVITENVEFKKKLSE